MKRRDLLRAGLGLGALTIAGCTPTPQEPSTIPSTTTSEEPSMTPSTPISATANSTGGRVLLAWFSRPGENYYNGGRIDLKVGNTEVVGNMIADLVSVDTYRIEAADPYPASYDATVVRNVQEERTNARPAIAQPLPDIAGYSTIVLGCPVWNVQSPMIVRTFLDGLDIADRTIHPFVTYAVSGMGRVRSDFTRLAPAATVSEGLPVRGEEAGDARNDVEAWLRQIRLLPG